ncbi:Potassium/sodium hyperpolarization-activated cyclic nucleotide-gated channel 4 [Anthophora plagiata]
MDLMAYVPHFSEAPNVERIPVIEHNCEQPQEQDELMNVKKGNEIWTKFDRWFLRQRIVSKKHPLTRWCLKSTTAVNYEISRHLKSHPYMIHPFSSFRIVWESLMTVFTIMALIITPVSITFYFEHYDNWHTINDIMNTVFLCDIIMWFFTGYYDYGTKVIVLDPVIVARKYLQSYFLVDLLTVLPIGILDYIIPSSVWYSTTLNMMKILRIRNIIVYSRRLHNVYRIGFQAHKILETITIIGTCVHWAACLEYYVPKSVEILGTLSNELVLPELILHNYKRLINSVELFKHLPQTVVIQLSSSLRSEIYMPGDEIVKAGSRGEALYFVSSGTVAIYTAVGKEICHLEDGSYFGEIALVMDSEHRVATVVAVETCEIYMLHRDDFRRYILPYPDLLNRLQNVALDHLNTSLLLDVAQDLSVSHTPQYVNISSIKTRRFTP